MGEERAETPNRDMMTYVRERWTKDGSRETKGRKSDFRAMVR